MTCLNFAIWAFQAGDSQGGQRRSRGSHDRSGSCEGGGAAFAKWFGLLQSNTSAVPKVNFGASWVTGVVEDDADAGASTFHMGEGVLQLSLIVSMSMSALEEQWDMTTPTSNSKQ